jgi:uncharacterized protein YneF (UPF0154 family)
MDIIIILILLAFVAGLIVGVWLTRPIYPR